MYQTRRKSTCIPEILVPCRFQVISFSLFVPTNRIENYSKWQFVSQFLSYVDSETRALHKEMKRRTLNRVHDERGVECVQLAESVLPLALARPFVEKLLPKGNTVWEWEY